jgi:hypothetical protein
MSVWGEATVRMNSYSQVTRCGLMSIVTSALAGIRDEAPDNHFRTGKAGGEGGQNVALNATFHIEP